MDQPEDRRIDFRISVHLGDVVEEADGDLMGDGVNIAARLEGIAQPGAICLSEDAYRQALGMLPSLILFDPRNRFSFNPLSHLGFALETIDHRLSPARK